MEKDTKTSFLRDPDDYFENQPFVVGTILGESDRGKVKLKTLSQLGAEHIVWISKDDILKTEVFEDNITKLHLKQGADVLVETISKVRVGTSIRVNDRISVAAPVPINASSPPATSDQPTPKYYKGPPAQVLPEHVYDSGIGSSTGEGGGAPSDCTNCDWVQATHCVSCTDNQSNVPPDSCLTPFLPVLRWPLR